MADRYVLVRGGLVQNDPALPVFDLDVLDSDVPPEDVVDEVRQTLARAREHQDTPGVEAIVDEILDWLGEHGFEEKVALPKVKAPQYEEEW